MTSIFWSAIQKDFCYICTKFQGAKVRLVIVTGILTEDNENASNVWIITAQAAFNFDHFAKMEWLVTNIFQPAQQSIFVAFALNSLELRLD